MREWMFFKNQYKNKEDAEQAAKVISDFAREHQDWGWPAMENLSDVQVEIGNYIMPANDVTCEDFLDFYYCKNDAMQAEISLWFGTQTGKDEIHFPTLLAMVLAKSMPDVSFTGEGSNENSSDNSYQPYEKYKYTKATGVLKCVRRFYETRDKEEYTFTVNKKHGT